MATDQLGKSLNDDQVAKITTFLKVIDGQPAPSHLPDTSAERGDDANTPNVVTI